MSELEAYRPKVKKLLDDYGFEIWQSPSHRTVATEPTSAAPTILWSMRIGHPGKNEEMFVDSLEGELGLWREAEHQILSFAKQTAQSDAKALMQKIVAFGKKPDTSIANAQLQLWAIEAGIDGPYLDGALILAGDREWIDHSKGAGWTKLTLAGWEAGNA